MWDTKHAARAFLRPTFGISSLVPESVSDTKSTSNGLFAGSTWTNRTLHLCVRAGRWENGTPTSFVAYPVIDDDALVA